MWQKGSNYNVVDDFKRTNKKLSLTEPVKVKQYGNTILLQTLVKAPERDYQQLGKTKRNAGERGQNLGSLKRTMRNIRELIAVNFDGEAGKGGVFVTLTFADSKLGADIHEVQRAMANFLKRLKRRYINIVYLGVIEPQPQRSDREQQLIWHFHVLIKYQDNHQFYVDQHELQDLWGNGIVFIEKLQKYRSVSAYLSAYLTDLKIDVDSKEQNNKHIIKGQKLLSYPAGIRIYRASQNVQRPQVSEYKTKQAAIDAWQLSEDNLTYHTAYEWFNRIGIKDEFISEYYRL